jgi:hypothetical protein
MRKAYSILLVFIICTLPVEGYSQRHLKGLKGLEGQAGFMNNLDLFSAQGGGYLTLGYSNYVNSLSYWKLHYDFDKKNYQVLSSPVFSSRQTAGLSYFRSILKDREGNIYLNMHGGAFMGYENVNNNSRVVSGMELKARSKLIYGLSFGLESEVYLYDNLALLFHFRERWLIPSETMKFRWYAGTGVKWIINR